MEQMEQIYKKYLEKQKWKHFLKSAIWSVPSIPICSMLRNLPKRHEIDLLPYIHNSYPIFERKYLETQRLDSYNHFSSM